MGRTKMVGAGGGELGAVGRGGRRTSQPRLPAQSAVAAPGRTQMNAPTLARPSPRTLAAGGPAPTSLSPGPHQALTPPFPGDPAPPAPLGPACSLLAPPGDHRTRRATRAPETTQSFGAESQVGEDWGHTAGPGWQGSAPLSPWALGSLPFD